MLFADRTDPVVELGLKIASFTYGGLLGTFFLGLAAPRTSQGHAVAGFIAGIAGMVLVWALTRVDFTWYTFIGCAITVATGTLASLVMPVREGVR